MWARPLKDRHAHELQVLRERPTRPPRSSPRGNTSKVILTLYQKPNRSTAWVRVRGELKAHRFHRPAQAPPKPKKKHNRFHTHLTKPIAGEAVSFPIPATAATHPDEKKNAARSWEAGSFPYRSRSTTNAACDAGAKLACGLWSCSVNSHSRSAPTPSGSSARVA